MAWLIDSFSLCWKEHVLYLCSSSFLKKAVNYMLSLLHMQGIMIGNTMVHHPEQKETRQVAKQEQRINNCI